MQRRSHWLHTKRARCHSVTGEAKRVHQGHRGYEVQPRIEVLCPANAKRRCFGDKAEARGTWQILLFAVAGQHCPPRSFRSYKEQVPSGSASQHATGKRQANHLRPVHDRSKARPNQLQDPVKTRFCNPECLRRGTSTGCDCSHEGNGSYEVNKILP